jgi:predicted transcriptional regulator
VPQFNDGFLEAHHAVMIGCAIEHAHRFVYADQIDLNGGAAAVPIGVTCRQCPREDCARRAFDRLPVLGMPPRPAARAVT